jgi:hypothetical protein
VWRTAGLLMSEQAQQASYGCSETDIVPACSMWQCQPQPVWCNTVHMPTWGKDSTQPDAVLLHCCMPQQLITTLP